MAIRQLPDGARRGGSIAGGAKAVVMSSKVQSEALRLDNPKH